MLSKIESPEFHELETKLDEKIRGWIEEDKARDKKAFSGRYLDNKEAIQRTKMYKLAAKMPKGGHLHIHFNSVLKPNVLLDIATESKVNKRMFISLPGHEGALTKENIQDVQSVKFHFMGSPDPQPTNVCVGNVFAEDYGKLTEEKMRAIGPESWVKRDNARIHGDINDLKRYIAANESCIQKRERESTASTQEKNWFQDKKNQLESKKSKLETEQRKRFEDRIKLDERMLFSEFLKASKGKVFDEEPMEWLRRRLVFSEEDVTYTKGTPDTCRDQWKLFDKRTQMMAGLFNNEHAYRKYTRQLLDSLRDENIQYAEIRPNFMNKNQVFTEDDPNVKMDNRGIVTCIVEEYKTWKSKNPDFGGLKIIYCTPRVFQKEDIEKSLSECLKLKQDPELGKYIAGFDIIGPENADNPLMFFKEELKKFQAKCKLANVKCPFLFHAGESHNDPKENLNVALELKAKRIAHGYAIPRKSSVFRDVKRRGKDLCIECCPISNEILGLHPYVKDSVVYDLMNAEVPCALASDNPTLFSSTLSHDFYQFMVGKMAHEKKPSKKPGEEGFHLQDWKQLIMDSLEHAVWNNPKEHADVFNKWSMKWYEFVKEASGDPDFFGKTPSGGNGGNGGNGPSAAPKPVPSPRPGPSAPNSVGGAAPRRTTTLKQDAHKPSPVTKPKVRSTQGPGVSGTSSEPPRAATPRKTSGIAVPSAMGNAAAAHTVGTKGTKPNGTTPVTPPKRKPTQTALENEHDAAPRRTERVTVPIVTARKPTAKPNNSSSTTTGTSTPTTAATRGATRPGVTQLSTHGSANTPSSTTGVASSNSRPSASTSTAQADRTATSQTRRARGSG